MTFIETFLVVCLVGIFAILLFSLIVLVLLEVFEDIVNATIVVVIFATACLVVTIVIYDPPAPPNCGQILKHDSTHLTMDETFSIVDKYLECLQNGGRP